jgi:hypothetical protein
VNQRPRINSAKVHKAANKTLAKPGRCATQPRAKPTQTAEAAA